MTFYKTPFLCCGFFCYEFEDIQVVLVDFAMDLPKENACPPGAMDL